MRVVPHSVLNSNSHISVFQEVGRMFADPATITSAGSSSLPHKDLGLFPMPKPLPLITTPLTSFMELHHGVFWAPSISAPLYHH